MSPYVAATTPYSWPFDADLAGAATALVVVVPVGGPRPSADVTARVRELAAAMRTVGGVVIAATTRAPVRAGLAASPDAPPGATSDVPAVVDVLGPFAPDHTVAAGGVDAFYASDLDLLLRTRGIVRLLIAGVGLETSAHSTMRDANDRGYECLLVADACEPVDPALVGPALSMVEMSGGIFGAVGRTTDVVAALATIPTPAAPAPVPGLHHTQGALR